MARMGSPFIITGTLGEINFYVGGRTVWALMPRISRPGPKWAAYGNMAENLALVPGQSRYSWGITALFCWYKGQKDPIRNGGHFCPGQGKGLDIGSRGELTIVAGPAPTDGLHIQSSYSYRNAYSLCRALGCQFRVDRAQRHCTFPDLDPAVTAFPERATI